ncbi:hypothetical protein WOLCODRAFT_75840 [Wolfiporia cocos MD-104 SS10]|uniref:Carbohydrate esterase family 9 protein n=1 Tax=Wolfiporia cocos (strain MD-104) TaxID=742152 RepID=A0A2H3K3P4_WOLCO|nr:hypothetical protein WOLCODRAFT_75840 [Wolfiporia cocos MD-104 SS10]
MTSAEARRATRAQTLRLLLAALVLCVVGSVFLSYTSITFSVSVSRRVPRHASSVLAKCADLRRKPRPSEGFYEREQSDRFQPGTRPLHIRNATLWTGRVRGMEVLTGDLFLEGGIIRAVGHVGKHLLSKHRDVETLDAHGAWVTPGIVDMHSHLAVEASPSLVGAQDGNSFQGLVLPWLRSLDALNTHDDGFRHSLSGGVTTSLILPGSADAIGGQAFTMKLRPTDARSPSSMLLEPPFLYNGTGIKYEPTRWRHMKHACGASRVYDGTRMDTTWAYRQAYNKAREIKVAQDEYCALAEAGDWRALAEKSFPEELQWEALVDVLRGRVKVHTHCYEAVDFDDFVRLSNEFEFPVAAFHHAHEAYLVPEVIKNAYAEHPPAIAMFAAFSRYKREAYRHSEFAPRILEDNDIPVIMKSDHPAIMSRFLINEAAQAHYYGLSENIALASVISTPAAVLGLDHRIGFLREGTHVVVWDSHPLSLGATPTQVIIDGIPQISPAYTLPEKPASHQRAPVTPDFDAEAAAALAFDGLPPLQPRSSGLSEGILVFRNVAHVWVKAPDGRNIVDLVPDREGLHPLQHPDVVVERGKIVCVGANCGPHRARRDTVEVDLHGGALQPGLVSFGSNLGLQEIAMEVSTTDGVALDPLAADVPAIAGGAAYVPHAADGLMFGTRDALLAYRHGVTVGITAPSHTSFLGGLSAAFSLGSAHKLEEGALVQEVTALHVSLAHGTKASVSTEVGVLRQLLLPLEEFGKRGFWFEKVVNGEIPLVVDVDSADLIATLIRLKMEVEAQTGRTLRLTIAGAAEAHLLAAELAEANIGVILSPARSYPFDWDRRRILPGPPLTPESALTKLLSHNVTLGLGPQGVNAASGISTWAVRNLRFDAAWATHIALLDAPHFLDKASAFSLASSNIETLLGLDVRAGEEDLVATSGGDLLGFEGKVVAVISARRGTVDTF